MGKKKAEIGVGLKEMLAGDPSSVVFTNYLVSHFNRTNEKVEGGQKKADISGVYTKDGRKFYLKFSKSKEPDGRVIREYLASILNQCICSESSRGQFATYHLVKDKESGKIGLATEMFEDFEPLYKHFGLGHDLRIKKEFFNKTLENLSEKNIKILCRVIIMRLLLLDPDIHTENVGRDKNNKIVTFDYDWAFAFSFVKGAKDPTVRIPMLTRRGTQATNHVKDFSFIINHKYFAEMLALFFSKAEKIDFNDIITSALGNLWGVVGKNEQYYKKMLLAFIEKTTLKETGCNSQNYEKPKIIQKEIASSLARILKQNLLDLGLLSKFLVLKLDFKNWQKANQKNKKVSIVNNNFITLEAEKVYDSMCTFNYFFVTKTRQLVHKDTFKRSFSSSTYKKIATIQKKVVDKVEQFYKNNPAKQKEDFIQPLSVFAKKSPENMVKHSSKNSCQMFGFLEFLSSGEQETGEDKHFDEEEKVHEDKISQPAGDVPLLNDANAQELMIKDLKEKLSASKEKVLEKESEIKRLTNLNDVLKNDSEVLGQKFKETTGDLEKLNGKQVQQEKEKKIALKKMLSLEKTIKRKDSKIEKLNTKVRKYKVVCLQMAEKVKRASAIGNDSKPSRVKKLSM